MKIKSTNLTESTPVKVSKVEKVEGLVEESKDVI